MAVSLGSDSVSRQERTRRLIFDAPYGENYSMRIHREIVTTNSSNHVLAIETVANVFNKEVPSLIQMQATIDFHLAAKNAATPLDLVYAIAVWCDALVAEDYIAPPDFPVSPEFPISPEFPTSPE